MPADPFLAETRLNEAVPRSLDAGAAAAMNPKPKRVLSLGQRIREEGFGVVWAGMAMSIIFGLPVMLLLAGITASFSSNIAFTPATFIVLYIIAFIVTLPVSTLLANAMENDTVTSKTRRDEDLIRAIRLPLLEWAVRNDCVDQIDGLDFELSKVVAEHYRLKRSS